MRSISPKITLAAPRWMTSGPDTISFILSSIKRSSSARASSSMIIVLKVLRTLELANQIFEYGIIQANVPHPDNVLLVLCPVLEFCRRQSFWWLNPESRDQEIE